MANNTGGFVQGLRPTTRKPRDGRASPIADPMARSQPDAPRRAGSGSGGSAPVVNTAPVAVRTSKARKGSKAYGDY